MEAKIDFSPEGIAKHWPNIHNAATAETTPEEIAERERQHEQHVSRLRRMAADGFARGRGARYSDCRLENYRCDCKAQTAAVERLTQYLDNATGEIAAGNGIVLYGGSGSGKDHLAVAMAYEIISRHGATEQVGYRESGLVVSWVNGMDLFGQLRDAMDSQVSEKDILGPLSRCNILVLSDPIPPEGELTRYQRECLYRLLDARYSARRPTWVTLNVATGKEAAEKLGTPCYDRLRDGALCIYTNWGSYRKPRD